MANIDIIARLMLNAQNFSSENGRAFAELKQRAASTAADVRSSWSSTLSDVQTQRESLAVRSGSTGLPPSTPLAAPSATHSASRAPRTTTAQWSMAGYDAANLGNDHRDIVWRSGSGDAQDLLLDLGSDQAIDTVMLFGLTGNIPAGALAQLKLATAAQGSASTGSNWTSPTFGPYAGTVSISPGNSALFAQAGKALTHGEVLQAERWARDKYGAAYPWTGGAFRVFDGDSITSGYRALSLSTSYPALVAAVKGWGLDTWSNVDKAGYSMGQIAVTALSDVDSIVPVLGGTPVHLAVFEWYNQRNAGASDAWNATKAYLTARRAAGVTRLILGTSTDAADTTETAQNRTDRAAYDDAIASGYTQDDLRHREPGMGRAGSGAEGGAGRRASACAHTYSYPNSRAADPS